MTPKTPTALWRPAIGLSLFALLGTGLAYAVLATGIAGTLFPAQAGGSLVRDADGRVRGSLLLAQPFAGDGYFQARPSASGYDPMAAAGSNLARSNPDLRKRVDAAIAAVAAREGIAPADVPLELATQSGGGLDPHLTPAGARVQVARVAKARGLDPAIVQHAVDAATEAPQFGVLGQPRVNVLRLNLALDARQR